MDRLPRAIPERITSLRNEPNSREFYLAASLAVIHLPLGLVLYNIGSFALLHPLLIFGVGLVVAAKRELPLSYIALVVGYIVGSEVLWRMAGIPVYWESGKYMSAVVMIIALVRRASWSIPSAPAIYFLLLLPACILTVAGNAVSSVFQVISFTMSGPFLLAVSCWFFSYCRFTPFQLRRLLVAVVLPLISVSVATLFYTVTAEEIQFTGESNFATSGGFGPNQVSSMLGLGVFLALAGLVLFERRSRFGAYFAISALFLAAMSMMTFSRGGIYNAVGGVFVLVLFHFRDIKTSIKKVAPLVLLAAVFVFAIFPYLNSFTGGALEDRFEDTGTTNRWEIIEADIAVFLEEPLFGVGVGESRDSRKQYLEFGAASHTEFSRLLSEHGVFGLLALFALAVIAITNLQKANSILGRAFIAGAIAWSFFFMLNAGMRLAAPSIMLGVAYLTIAKTGGRLRFRSRPVRRLGRRKKDPGFAR